MWIKNIRQRKLQTILIFLIIAVCTTLLSGAMSILTSLDKPSKDFAKACNAATAKVYPNVGTEEAILAMGEEFENLPSIQHVEYSRSYSISEEIWLNDKKGEFYSNLTEYNDAIFDSVIYLEGNKKVSATLKDNECILPACISNEYDLHIGDQVKINLLNKAAIYTVAGVYTDPFQTSTAFDSDILIKKLPQVSGSLTIYVYGKEGITGKQIAREYLEKYDGIIHAIIFTLDDRVDKGLVVGKIIGALFLAIGVVMLLVSALMIHYMIKNAMLSDAKSIAVFKTIGYSSKDILLNYLKFYFVLVTLACILGTICSVFISDTILTSVFENMGELKVSHSFLSGVICYVVTVSFVITVITVIIAKTKKIKPVHSLNGLNYGGVKKLRHKGNSSLQFSSFGIAYRSFVREKRNAIGIIITCIVTVFSVNFIVISLDVAASMKENNDFWLGIDNSDVKVNISDPEEYRKVKKLLNKEERVDDCLYSNANKMVVIKWEKGMNTTFMNANLYEAYEEEQIPVTEGHNPKAYNEIAVSTTISKELHKEIGDYIEIFLDENTKVNMLITGLFQSYKQFGKICRLTASAYTRNGLEPDCNSISVYLKEGVDLEAFINDIEKQIGNSGKVIKRTQQDESIMNMIVKPQLRAIPPVALLIILIAGLNIFCIVYLKNLRAQRINGIYKCIGYTSWHLIFSNLCFVTVIALISILITVPINLVTYSPLMEACLSMYNFVKYPMQYDKLHLLLANIAIVLIFIISTLLSSKALFKVNARDLVQD